MRKKFILSIGTLLMVSSLPLITVSCNSKHSSKNENSGEVKRVYIKEVHDGDTIKDSKNVSYRLLGVDTPELMLQDGRYTFTKENELIWAQKARIFADNLVNHKNIKIETLKKGLHGRTVAKVLINEKETLGEKLVENGLAIVAYISNEHNKFNDYYYWDENYIRKLLDLQFEAVHSKRGFWKDISSGFITLKDIYPKSSWKSMDLKLKNNKKNEENID